MREKVNNYYNIFKRMIIIINLSSAALIRVKITHTQHTHASWYLFLVNSRGEGKGRGYF